MSTAFDHTTSPVRLKFGPFEMDLRSGELWKDGTPLKLPHQPFRILALLASCPGAVVTREEVRRHIWGDGTVVDFDQRVNACVNQIRSVLGDDADSPRYIETLPRRGYRWTGPVPKVLSWEPANGNTLLAEDDTAPPPEAPRPHSTPPRTRRTGRVAAAAIVLAALVGSAYWFGVQRGAPRLEWQRLTFQRGSVGGGRFTPSGDVVYGAAWDGLGCAVFTAVPGAPDPRKIGDGGCNVVGVSPQAEVAHLTDLPNATLARVPLAGGPQKEMLRGLAAADWSTTSGELATAVFVPGKTQMQIQWPAGQTIGSADSPAHLRIAPDGKHLAFLEHPVVGDDRGRVVVMDRSGRAVPLTSEWSSIEGLAWGPGAKELWFSAAAATHGTGLYAVTLSGRLRTLLEPERSLVLLDVAADGRALVDRSTRRQEIVFGGDDIVERNLSWLDMSSAGDIAPDGSTILLNETGAGGGADYGIYLRATDGSPPVRLGAGRATDISSDGQWVLSIPIQKRDRLELLPTGPGRSRTVQDAGIAEYEFAFFTPDDRRILFVGRDDAGVVRMYVRDVDGGGARPVAPENVRAQRFSPISPDGKVFIARCPPQDYCLYPLDGSSAPRRVDGTEGIRPLGWDASGRTLVMRERTLRPPVRLFKLDVASGRREHWRTVQPPDPAGVYVISGVFVTPDLRRYVYDYMRKLSELYLVSGLR